MFHQSFLQVPACVALLTWKLTSITFFLGFVTQPEVSPVLHFSFLTAFFFFELPLVAQIACHHFPLTCFFSSTCRCSFFCSFSYFSFLFFFLFYVPSSTCIVGSTLVNTLAPLTVLYRLEGVWFRKFGMSLKMD